MMSEHNIPWMEPVYWGNEEKYVVDALKSSWISGGKYTDLFEGRFANYIGAKYALTTSNGTSALHLAYLGLGLVAGDEIIVPGYCFMAAANVAINIGLKPVFVDVDRDTWCLSPADVERKITSKTKAIIPVHTYGNVSDMTPIIELANRYGLFVIEDAAESLGSKYAGQQSGTIGDVGTFSFHATKTVTTGEGGMVVTDNEDVYKRMVLYRNHGMGVRRYWHEVPGYNFRLTNLQAALGLAQLEKI
ncbi:DegT/DnrJ/EryC1/StrS family aminotransferase, partial [Sedimenticola sp.]|uniref:DegT/DnrJ/EryC1/StrS family aminotransferase n=1 Tax=Sedimenticola sp. TaxID=1940285 RepID=UPI003D131CBE